MSLEIFAPVSATRIGLTTTEARRRLGEFAPNAVPDEAPPRWLAFLTKFWGPVPCMLEAAIVLQLWLHAHVEAVVIGSLLCFNATLGCKRSVCNLAPTRPTTP